MGSSLTVRPALAGPGVEICAEGSKRPVVDLNVELGRVTSRSSMPFGNCGLYCPGLGQDPTGLEYLGPGIVRICVD